MKKLIVILFLLIATSAFATEGYYKQGFIIANIVADEDGNAKIDTPFQIYSQTITQFGRNSYCYLDNSMIGKEALIYISYLADDDDKVKSFKGYLGDDWKKVMKDNKALTHWNNKKEEALATTDALGNNIPYDKPDKLDIIHPYQADEKDKDGG